MPYFLQTEVNSCLRCSQYLKFRGIADCLASRGLKSLRLVRCQYLPNRPRRRFLGATNQVAAEEANAVPDSKWLVAFWAFYAKDLHNVSWRSLILAMFIVQEFHPGSGRRCTRRVDPDPCFIGVRFAREVGFASQFD